MKTPLVIGLSALAGTAILLGAAITAALVSRPHESSLHRSTSDAGRRTQHSRRSSSCQKSDNIIYFYNMGDPFYEFTNFFMGKPFCGEDPFHKKKKIEYKSSEHYFQAHKFLHNQTLFNQIVRAKTPSDALKLAGHHKSSIDKRWHVELPYSGMMMKDSIMLEALRLKFGQNEKLKKSLLRTGNRILVEDSPVDWYWGCGRDRTGKNMLGQLLMRVREELKGH